MSLQIWLPLNGDLTQQGLSNATVTNNGATVDNNGKIGKCYSFDGSGGLNTNYEWRPSKNWSICLWVAGATKQGTCIRNSTKYSPIIDFGGGINAMRLFYWYDASNYYMLNASIDDSGWHHLAGTCDGTTMRLYIDGVEKYSCNVSAHPTPYSTGHTQIGFCESMSNFSGGKLNDVRIYDHCLSPKEVKELAKGLVLHYRLAGPGQPNLLNGNIHLASAWTQENHTVVNYSDSNFTGLKITATQANGRIYNSVSNLWITNNAKYTVSFWAKSDTAGTTIDCSRSIADFSPTFTLDTNWKYYSGIITTRSTSEGGTLSIRINQASRVVYIANIKVENGAIATPFVPPSNSSIYNAMGYNNNIEYDCSGYSRNGTKSGQLTWNVDSPRYTTSYKVGLTKAYVNTPNIAFERMPQGTLNMWINRHSSTSDWRQYACFANGYNWTSTEQDFIIIGSTGGATIVLDCCSNTYSYTPTLNEWHMYTITWDLQQHTSNFYIDGELVRTTTNAKIDTLYASKHNYHAFGNRLSSDVNDYSMSDARIYSTVLSAEVVAELYHSAVIIDNTGKTYAYEYFE